MSEIELLEQKTPVSDPQVHMHVALGEVGERYPSKASFE